MKKYFIFALTLCLFTVCVNKDEHSNKLSVKSLAALSYKDAAVALPSPASVHLDKGGRFYKRFHGNVKYVIYQHDYYGREMLRAYSVRHYSPGKLLELVWDREYGGKWLDSATRTAVNTGNKELLAMVDNFADSLRQLQQPDGYMGIELPNDRVLNGWEKDWDIWNQFYAILGLLTHYELRNDQASLDAAFRAGIWIIKTYGPVRDKNSPFLRGEAVGGFTKVVVIGQLVRLYQHTGDIGFLEFVRQVIDNYPPVKQMLSSSEPSLVHPYMLSAVLGGIVKFAEAAGDYKILAKVERIWEGLVSTHLFPTGSLGESEDLDDEPIEDVPDGQLQETCATTEWIFLTQDLYEATGRARYAEALELTVYNALLAAQSADGMKWCYWTPLRYSKHWFHGPTRCCFWSGPRGISRLPQLIYALKGDTVYINFFETSHAFLNTDSGEVSIIQNSQYPGTGESSVILKTQPDWKGMIQIRIPSWAKNFKIKLNGRPVPGNKSRTGYFEVDLHGSKDYQIEINFDIPFWLEKFAGGGCVMRRGPEIMSVDVRDNIDTWLGQDDLISIPEGVALLPIDPKHRYQWAGPVNSSVHRRKYCVRLDDKRTSEPRNVILTPYADAGNEGAAFRTVFLLTKDE